MKVLHWPRASGMTTELLKVSSETGFTVVCMTIDVCEQYLKRAKEMRCTIPIPISYCELLHDDEKRKALKGVLIDNLDCFFNYLFKSDIVKQVSIAKMCKKRIKYVAEEELKNVDLCTEICSKCGLNSE